MKAKILLTILILPVFIFGQKFDGLQTGMHNLYQLSDAKTRSISPENFTGEKGKGGMATEGTGTQQSRELGQGWKVSPSVKIKPKTIFTIAEIEGPGSIQHIWMTPTGNWRYSIIRFYWDDEDEPSVEVPVGDFFGMGWNKYSPLNSMAVCVNPGSAFNCYWPMPFRKKCKITMENIDDKEMTLYYQVDYTLTEVPTDAAYFHAQFNRVTRMKPKEDYVIVDKIKGKGQYVGTYMAFETHHNGWWGEGEIKFFMDGDKKFPTICGTGTEDYFCGSYDFDTKRKVVDGLEVKDYTEFSTAYAGLPQVIRGDGHYNIMQRFGMYRWHITDPVRFEKDLKITIQDLGWHQDGSGRYKPLEDDIATTAFWYQTEPHNAFPKLPSRDDLSVD